MTGKIWDLILPSEIIEFAANIWQTDGRVGYDLEVTVSLIFTRCFTGSISVSRDKKDINVNFICLIVSGRFYKMGKFKVFF